MIGAGRRRGINIASRAKLFFTFFQWDFGIFFWEGHTHLGSIPTSYRPDDRCWEGPRNKHPFLTKRRIFDVTWGNRLYLYLPNFFISAICFENVIRSSMGTGKLQLAVPLESLDSVSTFRTRNRRGPVNDVIIPS